MNLAGQAPIGERGYAMAVLLVGLGVMTILMTVAMPVWRQISQREREEELIFRGQQYARAIGLYQRKYANTAPASLDILVEQRFLRAKYTDPMVPGGEFDLLYQTSPRAGSSGGRGQSPAASPSTGAGQGAIGRGGVIGVVSKSPDAALRVFNGGTHYNEWQFVAVTRTIQPGVIPGAGGPGRGGRGGPSQGPAGTGTGTGPMTGPMPGQPPARRGQPAPWPPDGQPARPGRSPSTF